MKDSVGYRLPKFTESQKEKLKNSSDFVGLNYYTSFFAVHNQTNDPAKPNWDADSGFSMTTKAPHGISIGNLSSDGKLAVYARGLRKLLKYIKDLYGNPEIVIAENEYGEILGKNDGSLKVGLSDSKRKYYLLRHLLCLHEAVCVDKLKATGYFVWSLLDNFKWQEGYSTRYGLYYIDLKNNLTRHEKESAKWFSDFLKKEKKHSYFGGGAKKDEL